MVSAFRELYHVVTEQGEYTAAFAGKLHYQAENRSELEAVGDWVALLLPPTGRATITGALPCQSIFSRKAAGNIVEEKSK